VIAAPPTLALQDGQHPVQVIHSSLHSGANVDVQDCWPVLVGLQASSKVVVINLAAVQRVDLGRQEQSHRGNQQPSGASAADAEGIA